MAPASTTSSPGAAKAAARRLSGSRRRTEATPPRKLKPMSEILAKARYAVVEQGDYSDVSCEQCGTGDRDEELLLCDKCDKGFHMKCVRPIVARVPIGSWLCPNCSGHRPVRKLSQKKIIDFFRIQKGTDKKEKLGSPLGDCSPVGYCNSNGRFHWHCFASLSHPSYYDTRKRRRRSGPLVHQKKRRRLLAFVPSENPAQRLKQMGTLATALTSLQMEFSGDLTYMPGMAPRSANQARLEDGGMQVLSKEDIETLEHCCAMCKRDLQWRLMTR